VKDFSAHAVGDALHEALQAFGMERKIKEHEVILRWTELVGPVIAAHATPKRFINGILWVTVDDAAWRHQLSLDRIALLKKINETLGVAIIEDVRLR
jgi:predicted nucleic acid-binding Zn ribbon protein